jgi:DNA invertase Pin-like site-specific DNA recombinase
MGTRIWLGLVTVFWVTMGVCLWRAEVGSRGQPGSTVSAAMVWQRILTAPHLITLTNELLEQDVDLISLNDPIDTTTPQGRLMYNIFASLAEFERDIIRERTQAGLEAARARGRKGGRPKGLSKKAKATAMAAETLYQEGQLSVQAICNQLGISKPTLYSYLRHRGVKPGLRSRNNNQTN